MNIMIIALVTILFYATATVWQCLHFTRKVTVSRGVLGLGLAAVLLHAILLYRWIDVGIGQNLTFFNLFSLVTWLVAILMLLGTYSKPIANLGILVFPLAALSIGLGLTFPSFEIVHTAANPKELIHILLSTLAISTLCIAGLQAILLAIQERALRTKRVIGVLQILPPLEVMEELLFEMVIVGFVLFTIVLLTSLFSFYPILVTPLWQKSVLALFAWFLFAILLAGWCFLGWRGLQVIRWTLGGVFVVALIYFGSELL